MQKKKKTFSHPGKSRREGKGPVPDHETRRKQKEKKNVTMGGFSNPTRNGPGFTRKKT